MILFKKGDDEKNISKHTCFIDQVSETFDYQSETVKALQLYHHIIEEIVNWMATKVFFMVFARTDNKQTEIFWLLQRQKGMIREQNILSSMKLPAIASDGQGSPIHSF